LPPRKRKVRLLFQERTCEKKSPLRSAENPNGERGTKKNRSFQGGGVPNPNRGEPVTQKEIRLQEIHTEAHERRQNFLWGEKKKKKTKKKKKRAKKQNKDGRKERSRGGGRRISN